MANNDLVKKKPVALEVATYKRLSDLAAQLRINNPGGGFVSMSTAVGVLLDGFEVLEKCKQLVSNGSPFMVVCFDSPPTEPKIVDIHALTTQAIDSATSEFIDSLVDPVSLQAYAANAEANDPQYLKPKNE